MFKVFFIHDSFYFFVVDILVRSLVSYNRVLRDLEKIIDFFPSHLTIGIF